jgi:RNA polymerase sigma-70 factor (ECF subfamily)
MYAASMNEAPDRGSTPVQAPQADASALLLRVAEHRDKQALAALFTLFAPKLKSMMLRLGATEALADDLVQETMLTVWRKSHLYARRKGAASTWIYTIARNLRIDHVRRLSSRPYADVEALEIESDAPSSQQIIETDETVSRVKAALAILPKEQMEILSLSYEHDLSQTEIAEKLGLPLGTVKSRMRLAYEKLRPVLGDLQ